jgi:hypothetical protein
MVRFTYYTLLHIGLSACYQHKIRQSESENYFVFVCYFLLIKTCFGFICSSPPCWGWNNVMVNNEQVLTCNISEVCVGSMITRAGIFLDGARPDDWTRDHQTS